MNAYAIHSWSITLLAASLLVVEVLVGFVLIRLRSTPVAWFFAGAATIGMERLTADEPAGLRMLWIVAALFLGMKAVVGVVADIRPGLSLERWLGFAALWPGMRPAIFAASDRRASARPGLWLHGAVCIGLGLGLILGARLLAEVFWPSTSDELLSRWLITLPLMIGLSLVLHFGFFNLLAAGWSARGIDARPLFRAPLASSSLGDFWSRRWNLAFVEMTALVAYRPVSRWLGRPAASFVAFLFSGLLHEVAISVPVGAGYGLPLLYFAMHGCLVGVEANLERIGHPVSGWGVWRYVWTLKWLALPLPMLFHEPFLAGVVWPIIGH